MECKLTGSKAAEELHDRDLPLFVCMKRTMVSFAADGFSVLELHGKSIAVAYIRSFIRTLLRFYGKQKSGTVFLHRVVYVQ